MSNFVLSCCSTADLSKEHFDKRDVVYACAHYSIDGKNYDDDLYESMSAKDFYSNLTTCQDCSTSQINISEFLDHFTKYLEQGLDVLHISLSSGISGTVNSARNAASIAAERFPDRKIYVVDSLAASSGLGLIMDTLADMRDEGKTIDELRDWIEENKLRMHHWFFSTDLTFFVKGGRVSKVSGWVGGILNICPLLNVDYMGRLIPRHKSRGKKNAIHETLKRMEMYAENQTDYSGKCYISHSDSLEDATALKALIETNFPKLNGAVEIYNIGTTIGCHSGPGTVALFFWGEERKD